MRDADRHRPHADRLVFLHHIRRMCLGDLVGRLQTGRASFHASTSNSSRALTNWLGNSALSSFGNTALSRTVPVLGSIWLSTVSRVPVASCFCAHDRMRLRSVADRRFSRSSTAGRLSSGMVKTTVMGCELCDDEQAVGDRWRRTMLPGSTSRKPTRPLMGAVIRL